MDAAEGLCRSVYSGCISGNGVIERRPYHRNCSCALHKSRKSPNCSHAIPIVSYPIRRSWSEGCLALVAASHGSGSSTPYSSSSPVAVTVAERPPLPPQSDLERR